ncbi:DUF1003 domain-containing protein [Actinoallomurus purpureus]|uniref:DUF1003 domain-containing protein n=1 Tax=Actinoallomurus purpureus TaxID=478114 RepID=UPI0020927863|nr:DUF1003 domain-containing protein [Actinoallomurus purpureus]MCO6008013.1 DUF1003 domain-containing protein [Actinoallomurus purpureus]
MRRPPTKPDHKKRHPANTTHFDRAPLGARIANAVARQVGSWRFIAIQTALIAAWVAYNAAYGHPFDPWPFIALNLALSMEAAYTGPILQLSQNRLTAHAEARADGDYQDGWETHAMLLALIKTIEQAKSIQEIDQIDWRRLLNREDLGSTD